MLAFAFHKKLNYKTKNEMYIMSPRISKPATDFLLVPEESQTSKAFVRNVAVELDRDKGLVGR